MLKILLQGLGEFEINLLDWLSGSLPRFLPFSIRFKVSDRCLPVSISYYNSKRLQFNASQILQDLLSLFKKTCFFRILALTNHDIYVEGLNFIFGLAQKPHNMFEKTPLVALVSTSRLAAGLRESDSQIFKERLLKEVVHELGHTLSLDHCTRDCVMRFSNTISETDLKPAYFCSGCFNKIRFYMSNLLK